MKNYKKAFLVTSLITALGISTAYAATADTDYSADPHKMRHRVEAYQNCNGQENCPTHGQGLKRGHRGHGPAVHTGVKGAKAPFKLLAELTKQDEGALMARARSEQKTAPALAKELGVLKEFKAQRKAQLKERLDLAVKNGKIDQAKADKVMQDFDKRFDEAVENKRPRRIHNNPMHPGPQVPPDQMKNS